MTKDHLERAKDEARIGGDPLLGILYALIDIGQSQRLIAQSLDHPNGLKIDILPK